MTRIILVCLIDLQLRHLFCMKRVLWMSAEKESSSVMVVSDDWMKVWHSTSGSLNRLLGKEKKPVCAVVLEDLGTSPTYSCAEIKSVCEKSGYGLISSNDFLKTDAEQTEEKNNRKRRCLEVHENYLPPQRKLQIVKIYIKYQPGRL